MYFSVGILTLWWAVFRYWCEGGNIENVNISTYLPLHQIWERFRSLVQQPLSDLSFSLHCCSWSSGRVGEFLKDYKMEMEMCRIYTSTIEEWLYHWECNLYSEAWAGSEGLQNFTLKDMLFYLFDSYLIAQQDMTDSIRKMKLCIDLRMHFAVVS